MVKRILFLLVISSALQSMVTAAEEPSINLEVARELFSRSGMFRIGSALDTVSFAAPFPLCKNALYDCDEFSRKYIARADEPVNLRSLCCALEKAHRSLCYRKEGSIFWGVADTCLRIRSGEIETRQCLYARCIDESFVIVALDNAEIVRECACYDAKKMRTDFWVESWYFVVHQDSDLLLRSLFGEEDIEATACGEEKSCDEAVSSGMGDSSYRRYGHQRGRGELGHHAKDYVASPSVRSVSGSPERSPVGKKIRRKKRLARPIMPIKMLLEAALPDVADEEAGLKRAQTQRDGIRSFMLRYGVRSLSDYDCNAIIVYMSSHSSLDRRLTDSGHCLVRRPDGRFEVMVKRTVRDKKIRDTDVFLRNGDSAAPGRANLEMLWRRVRGEDGWLAKCEG